MLIMSGIEIVGLLFSVLPVVISAGQYAEKRVGRRVAGGFHYRRILRRFTDDLDGQRTLLQLHLEDLINRTGLSPSQRQDLLEDLDNGSSESWDDPEIDAEFKILLGAAKGPFDRLMTTMMEELESLVLPDLATERSPREKVGRLRSLKELGNPKAVWARLKFAWDVPERNVVLQNIERCNAKIATLKQAITTTKASNRRYGVGQIHMMFKVRDHAHRLFEVLSASCTCEPRPLHHAKLRLRRRDDISANSKEALFDVLLEISSDCCRVTVNVSGDKDENVCNETWETLHDICGSIQQACSHGLRPTWAIDCRRVLWCKNVTSLDSTGLTKPFVTLEECLQVAVPSTRPAIRRLAREKHVLSIVLAHSLPQFYGTPWLNQHWTMKSILLLRQDPMLDPASVDFGRLLRYPYMSEILSSQRQRSLASAEELQPSRSHSQDPCLFTLGILLLELFLGRCISKDMEAVDSPIAKALDLLGETYHDSVNPQMNSLYFEAVKFCLWPTPDPVTREVSFEESGFRELYYQGVIVPLEQDLQDTYEISNPQLLSAAFA